MGNLLEILRQYTSAGLLILVPVLYVLKQFLKISKLKNERIPLVIVLTSLFLCGFHVFATSPIGSLQNLMVALFAIFTQAILFAGGSILGDIVMNPAHFMTDNSKPKPE